MIFERESSGDRAAIDQGSIGNRSVIDQGKRKKQSLSKQEIEDLIESEKKLSYEVMAQGIELRKYKEWHDSLQRENAKMKQELKIGLYPLREHIAAFEKECAVCMETSAEKFTELKSAYRRVVDKNKKLIDELRSIKKERDEGLGMFAQWKEVNELNRKLESQEAEIEKLRNRIDKAGRKPITQNQIDKIHEYKEKGYSHRSIAYHAGVSTSTVSKYINKDS